MSLRVFVAGVLLLFFAAPVHAQDLGKLISPGDLSVLHKEIEGIKNCVECHNLTGGIPNEKCVECHKDIGERMNRNHGYHATSEVSKKKCFECHSDHKGLGFEMIKWERDKFDHSRKNTAYELTGKHARTKCRDCHKVKTKRGRDSYLLASSTCISCHEDIHKKTLGEKCEDCHNANSWKGKDVKFDHDKPYKLTGKHAKVKCADCHKTKGLFKVEGFKKCVTCHQKDDKHKGKLGPVCEDCHVVDDWKKLSFNHSKTKYPLTGKHVKVKCEKCHVDSKSGQFKVKGYDKCVTCHEKDDKHKGSLGKVCEDCHVVDDWKKLRFNHSKTKYPLAGKHRDVKCEKCHVNAKAGQYKFEKFDTCSASGCHDTKARGAIHGTQFKGRKCEECHTINGWKPSLFKHEDTRYKGFKLLGKHAKAKCEDCHRKNLKGMAVYKPIGYKTCDGPGCHDTKKRGNVHGKQFKGQGCDSCHNENNWKPSLFKHEDARYKGFKLLGKHAKAKCEKCHVKDLAGRVAYKPLEYKTCGTSGCHDTKERGNVHGRQFRGRDCAECHNEENWKPSLFKHEASTYKGYKLLGKHAKAKCDKCHVKDRKGLVKYRPIDTRTCDTSGCHDTKERGNVHGRQFRGKRCDQCHTEKGWKELRFDHDKDSKYPLYGKHRQVKCGKCHANKVWKPLRQKCYDCHSKKDVHKGTLGTKCEECHNEESWKPGKEFHKYTGFKLDGAHGQLKCADCHKTKETYGEVGEYCADCHKDPHFNQFGVFCSDCHSSKTWEPLEFEHNRTGFRLEGAHRQAECQTCHVNRDYRHTPTDCFSCHRSEFFSPKASSIHNPSNTNCGDCHKVYAWTPATGYAHQVMTFTGAHRSIQSSCGKCHASGSNALLFPGAQVESDCDLCHMADYAKEHGRGEGGLPPCPQTCSLCHNTSTFDDARETISCD